MYKSFQATILTVALAGVPGFGAAHSSSVACPMMTNLRAGGVDTPKEPCPQLFGPPHEAAPTWRTEALSKSPEPTVVRHASPMARFFANHVKWPVARPDAEPLSLAAHH